MTPVETLREAARRIRSDRAGDDTYDGRTLLAVADWLEDAAESQVAAEGGYDHFDVAPALAVARAYLGDG